MQAALRHVFLSFHRFSFVEKVNIDAILFALSSDTASATQHLDCIFHRVFLCFFVSLGKCGKPSKWGPEYVSFSSHIVLFNRFAMPCKRPLEVSVMRLAFLACVVVSFPGNLLLTVRAVCNTRMLFFVNAAEDSCNQIQSLLMLFPSEECESVCQIVTALRGIISYSDVVSNVDG